MASRAPSATRPARACPLPEPGGLPGPLHARRRRQLRGRQHFGSLGRDAFNGPGYFNIDLSVVKNTMLTERVRLQVRVDVFNVLNHPNYANPLLPNFAVDFLQNGIDADTNRGVGFLPLTATPDVATGSPFLGGGGPRHVQVAAPVSF